MCGHHGLSAPNVFTALATTTTTCNPPASTIPPTHPPILSRHPPSPPSKYKMFHLNCLSPKPPPPINHPNQTICPVCPKAKVPPRREQVRDGGRGQRETVEGKAKGKAKVQACMWHAKRQKVLQCSVHAAMAWYGRQKIEINVMPVLFTFSFVPNLPKLPCFSCLLQK